MKKRNIIASVLVIFGIVMSAYYLGFADTTDEGLTYGFAMLGMYGSIAISVIGVLIFLVGWIIDKKSKKNISKF